MNDTETKLNDDREIARAIISIRTMHPEVFDRLDAWLVKELCDAYVRETVLEGPALHRMQGRAQFLGEFLDRLHSAGEVMALVAATLSRRVRDRSRTTGDRIGGTLAL